MRIAGYRRRGGFWVSTIWLDHRPPEDGPLGSTTDADHVGSYQGSSTGEATREEFGVIEGTKDLLTFGLWAPIQVIRPVRRDRCDAGDGIFHKFLHRIYMRVFPRSCVTSVTASHV